MARIAFAMLPEPGHMFPTYKLAKKLRSRGHDIVYLAPTWGQTWLQDEELDCITGLEDLWEAIISAGASGLADANRIILGSRAEILRLLSLTAMDLIIIDGFLPAVASVAMDVGVTAVLLHTNLQSMPELLIGDSSSFAAGTNSPFVSSLKIVEMVLCPREFEFSSYSSNNRARYYIEPSVDLDREEPSSSWGDIPNDKPLIYCSFGSQARFAARETKALMQNVIDAMAAKPDWSMVLSIGTYQSAEEFRCPPPNVTLVNWAPQIRVLRRTSIMITHGGLGTIKECILLGVPMIVFPLMRDQPFNAARVAYHGIGLRGDTSHPSVENMLLMIGRIDSDPSFKARIEAMRARFLEAEGSWKGPDMIEKLVGLAQRRQQERKGLLKGQEQSLSRT
jgi:UDP:flavonoid glycosyltransferase YjiC (YdhE family)